MRAFIAFALLLSLLPSLPAQDLKTLQEQEIRNLYEQEKYYGVFSAQDAYFRRFPDNTLMQMIRLYSWLKMNDRINFREDLDKVAWTNPEVASHPYFRICSDKKYLAELITGDYITGAVLDPGRDYRPLLTACDTVRGALRQARSCFDVGFYDLSLSIFPDTRSIEGKNEISFTITEPTGVIQLDLFDNYDIRSIRMNGADLNYTRVCQAIFIRFDREMLPGEKCSLVIEYAGIPREAPNPPWNGGFVWKKNKGRDWVGVACEQFGASSWWPVKDHLSDKPDSMRITIRVPGKYQAVSNGNLRSVKKHDDKTVSYEWFVSYPINSYNVTFYMGDFVNFYETYTDEKESYQVDYYVLKKNLKKARQYYSQTKEILQVFTRLYGEYPFPRDGAGFVEAPYEGMENQGAIAIGGEYGGSFLNYAIDPQHDYLLVHETAHEWWGNSVTLGDMADAWINEGFATFSEYLFLENTSGYKAYLNAFGIRSRNIHNAWPLVGARGVNDNTFIGSDIYVKGAAMLNNLRCIINDDSLFFSIIKGFYQEYKMKITETNDFLAYVSSHYPVDLADFFNVFLNNDDPPVLEYSFALWSGTLLFNYRWTGVGKGFTMPFAVVINDTTSIRLSGTTAAQQFIYKGAGSFYLPNPFHFQEDILEPNSFTYYQTYWKRD